MRERTIYIWTDRAEHAYATLRDRAGHWDVEWGYRDPPGSDHYVQQGDHRTSVGEEAVRLLVAQVRALGAEPSEAEHLERDLRTAVLGEQAGSHRGSHG